MSRPAPGSGPGSEAGKPTLWIPDTSSLISLAVDDELFAAVQSELSGDHRALLDVVVDELDELADGQSVVKTFADTARKQLAWLGEPVDTDHLGVDVNRVVDIQNIIRGGRPLRHPWEHWAESVVIDIAERLTAVRPVLLTEDYNARIEADQRDIKAMSLHKLFSNMIRSGRLSAARAELFADRLKKADRGQEYSAEEFQTGKLGRVGQP